MRRSLHYLPYLLVALGVSMLVLSVRIMSRTPPPFIGDVAQHLRDEFAQQQEALDRLKAQVASATTRTSNRAPVLGKLDAELVTEKKEPEIDRHDNMKPKKMSLLVHPELDALQFDYQACRQSLEGRPTRKLLPKLHWIHIPKAGTAFGYTLFSYLCTDDKEHAKMPADKCTYCGALGKKGTWDRDLVKTLPLDKFAYCDKDAAFRGLLQNHLPVPVQPAHDDYFVALFRDPRKRLVSAYNHDKHSFGIGQRDAKTAMQRREYMLQHTHSLEDFARFPDIMNCQTKMMLGEYCAIDSNLTRFDVERAKQVLERFAFVGITEAFNASVCLFHHMFGGELREFEFSNMRVAKPFDSKRFDLLPGGSLKVPAEAWEQLPSDIDPYDWEVYQYARLLFAKKLQEYGLYVPPKGSK